MDVIQLAKDICSALAFCQKKGMIHRDIKPKNVFVNEDGRFKLGDFGVARTVEKTTGGLSKKGTESYMAPEVYLGKPYGATVDIYSLGLMLYKFTNNNRLPFFPPAPQPITFADRENALLRRMKGDTLPAPANAQPEFAKIILKACAYKPEERYRTAAEMLEELKGIQVIPSRHATVLKEANIGQYTITDNKNSEKNCEENIGNNNESTPYYSTERPAKTSGFLHADTTKEEFPNPTIGMWAIDKKQSVTHTAPPIAAEEKIDVTVDKPATHEEKTIVQKEEPVIHTPKDNAEKAKKVFGNPQKHAKKLLFPAICLLSILLIIFFHLPTTGLEETM